MKRLVKPLALAAAGCAVAATSALAGTGKAPVAATPAAPTAAVPGQATAPCEPCWQGAKGYTIVKSGCSRRSTTSRRAGAVDCPFGTVPLGGGAFIPSNDQNLNVNSSFPTTTGWVADVNNVSGAAGSFYVQAVCAKMPRKYRVLESSPFSVGADAQASGTEACTGRTRASSAAAACRTPAASPSTSTARCRTAAAGALIRTTTRRPARPSRSSRSAARRRGATPSPRVPRSRTRRSRSRWPRGLPGRQAAQRRPLLELGLARRRPQLDHRDQRRLERVRGQHGPHPGRHPEGPGGVRRLSRGVGRAGAAPHAVAPLDRRCCGVDAHRMSVSLAEPSASLDHLW